MTVVVVRVLQEIHESPAGEDGGKIENVLNRKSVLFARLQSPSAALLRGRL